MMERKRQPISDFSVLGEFDRDDTGREGAVEHGPEAFAHAGGVDDDVLGMPGFGQGFDLAEDAEVVFADPTVAGNDMIGGALEGGEGGEVDLDDGEGGGITAGVAEAEVRGCGAGRGRDSSMPATSRRNGHPLGHCPGDVEGGYPDPSDKPWEKGQGRPHLDH